MNTSVPVKLRIKSEYKRKLPEEFTNSDPDAKRTSCVIVDAQLTLKLRLAIKKQPFDHQKHLKRTIQEISTVATADEHDKCKISGCYRYVQDAIYPLCSTHYARSYQCLDCAKWLSIRSLRKYDGQRCAPCYRVSKARTT